MASTADTYRNAAREHLERAQDLFDREEYFLAHYLSGIAVECHLRAYLRRVTDQFESRHDSTELAKESGYIDMIPPKRGEDFSDKFSTLSQRWRSNHRYYLRTSVFGLHDGNPGRVLRQGRPPEEPRPHGVEPSLRHYQSGRSRMGQQVKQILEASFPGIGAKLETLASGRLFGTAIWDGFDGHDNVERQQMIRRALRDALGEEARQIGVLLTYTPKEMWVMQEA